MAMVISSAKLKIGASYVEAAVTLVFSDGVFMSVVIRFLTTILCFLFAGTALAEHMGPHYMCSHHDVVREIKVVYEIAGEEVPCAVHYHKAGGEQILWMAQAEAGYCEQKAESFVSKQQGWGWSCEQHQGAHETTAQLNSSAAEYQ